MRKKAFRNSYINYVLLAGIVGAIALAIVTVLIGQPSQTPPSRIEGNNFRIFPIDSRPYNITQNEWTARWWQWAASIPKENNPVSDRTGEKCHLGQDGPVWFLAGTTGGNAERNCTIPEGKAILLPILNAVYDNIEYPGLIEPELINLASADPQNESVQAIINGKQLTKAEIYYIKSPVFDITYPKGNIFSSPEGTTKAASDGYWVFLEPLPAGEHEIYFKGTVGELAPRISFLTEVSYHITIIPDS